MNQEQLDAAAETAWQEGDSGHLCKKNCIESFQQGARWLMGQPLSERLTEEEKADIRKIYANAKELCGKDYIDEAQVTGGVTVGLLEGIFGTDLFNTDENTNHKTTEDT